MLQSPNPLPAVQTDQRYEISSSGILRVWNTLQIAVSCRAGVLSDRSKIMEKKFGSAIVI